MNPITAMIFGAMESPVEREAAFESRMNRLQTNCSSIRTEWATPNRSDGNWREPASRATSSAFVGGYVANAGTPWAKNPLDRALAFYNDK